MKTLLYVFVDVSGSMIEMGKIHLQRNLCRFISQLPVVDEQKYSKFEIRFFQWATDVTELYVQDNGDIPTLKAQGASDLNSLNKFLSSKLNNSQTPRVLLLTDGNISNSNIIEFKQGLASVPNLLIRAVAIGADADILKLKKLSTNNSVYLSENIPAAVDSLCFGMDKKITWPEFVKQICTKQPAETEDDWDD